MERALQIKKILITIGTCKTMDQLEVAKQWIDQIFERLGFSEWEWRKIIRPELIASKNRIKYGRQNI